MNDIILVILFNSKDKAWVQDYNILDGHFWAFSDGNTVWQDSVEKPFNFCLIEEEQFFKDSSWQEHLKILVEKSGKRKVYAWVHGSGASNRNQEQLVQIIKSIDLPLNINSFHNTNNYLNIKETIEYYFNIKNNIEQTNSSPLAMTSLLNELYLMRKAILEPLVVMELLLNYNERFDTETFNNIVNELRIIIQFNPNEEDYKKDQYGCNIETINILFNLSVLYGEEKNDLINEVDNLFDNLCAQSINFLDGASQVNEKEKLSVFHSNLENLANKLEYVISRTEG